ncbi:MAG: hypothetical protein ACSLEN_06790 [Candidatus Malihini olakiniferum]
MIESAVTGELVTACEHTAILATLTIGLFCMLLGMLLRPSVMPMSSVGGEHAVPATSWPQLLCESGVWRFLVCVALL